MNPIKVLSIVGARPQFVKLAPVERAMVELSKRGGPHFESIIVHTGQHYDDNMSKIFFDELGIPQPAFSLGIGSGMHGQQTGSMLTAIEQVLLQERPDAIVVYGDTNSTLAGVLAAVKLHIPAVHVEAGLRSFNRRMPEEINRVATDHLSDLLLAPTQGAIENLRREGLEQRSCYSGDVMYDAILYNSEVARAQSSVLERLKLKGSTYALVTLHRAENTVPQRLRELLEIIDELARTRCPVVFPVHPRTRRAIKESLASWSPHSNLILIDPLGYLDMLRTIQEARFIVTDSGGLQKECAFLQRMCFTVRDETEWLETIDLGSNVLVGSNAASLLSKVDGFTGGRGAHEISASAVAHTYGGGKAGIAVAEAIARLMGEQS